MQAILLVIHLIVAVSIIVTILIQPSEAGGFMGSGGSMANMMAPRRRGDVLTRMTTILAGLFFATSLLLAISANNQPVKRSILDLDTGDKPAIGQPKDNTPPKDQMPKAPITNDSGQADEKVPDEKAPAEKSDAAVTEDQSDTTAAAPKKEPAKNNAVKKKNAPKAPVTK